MVTDVNDELSKLVPEPWNPAPDPNTIRAAVARGANVNAIDSGGGSIVQRFIQNCRDPVVDTVQLLVELGADVNYQDTDGFCALSTAVFRHEPPLIACLLEAGANPNIILERHESILDMAEGDLEFHSFELNYDPQSEHDRKACAAALKEIITIHATSRRREAGVRDEGGPPP